MRGAESFREPPLTLTVLHTIGVEAQHPGSERVLTVRRADRRLPVRFPPKDSAMALPAHG